MGAVVIAQVVTSYLVSTVAVEVAGKLGLSDSAAGMVGLAAGMYAGGLVQAPTPTAGPVNAPVTSSLGSAGAGTVGPGPGINAGVGSEMAASGASGGGMLNQAGGNPGLALESGLTSPDLAAQSNNIVAQAGSDVVPPLAGGSVNGVKPPAGKENYWSQVFSAEKTGDLIVAGLGGMAKSDEARRDREYSQGIKDRNAESRRQSNLAGPGGGGLLSAGRQPRANNRKV